MMRRMFAVAVAMLLVALVASPAAAGPSVRSPIGPPLVGYVTDGPVLYDNSFVEAGWNGARAGAAAIGGDAVVAVTMRPSAEAYARNIERLVRRGAVVIVTVGFLMADATLTAANAHPAVQFFGIDQGVGDGPPNYQGLVFDAAQSGYLAGVVAGMITASGTVGTVGVDLGGGAFLGVLVYMNGYANGAASVDPAIGVSANYAGSFADVADGYAKSSELIAGGADVVFGVAGQSTEGVLAAACDAGKWGIGVDADGWVLYSELRPCIVTSAQKLVTPATTHAIVRWWADGKPTPQAGNFLNDVANGGIGLAPVRNVSLTVEQQAFLDAAIRGLADGSIDACSPQACDTQP